MKPVVRWIITAIVSASMLAAVFFGVVFYHPIMHAMGVEISGAPSTPPPTMFNPPTAKPGELVHGSGLISAAEISPTGALPDSAELQRAIASLDRQAAAKPTDTPMFTVAVQDVATGKTLAWMNPKQPVIPASNTKTLTMVAALHAMSPEKRFATRVMQPEPGKIVLVGGGDPMLALAPAAPGKHPRPASLTELADETAAALKSAGLSNVTLSYDDRLFEQAWNTTWPEGYRSQVTPLSALWVNTGIRDGHRSQQPALDATQQFAELLSKRGIGVAPTIQRGTLSGEELARVESLPLHAIIEAAMLASNNSWTEVVGYQLALATGHPATFEGSTTAIREQLTKLGLWSSEATLFDGSGLSRSNRITASMLAAVNRHIVITPRLSVLLDGLPVAGVTGTLHTRFTDPNTAVARGVAKAKTGTLTGVASLGGVTQTQDGRLVSFAIIVNGSSLYTEQRQWMDLVVGAITRCHA